MGKNPKSIITNHRSQRNQFFASAFLCLSFLFFSASAQAQLPISLNDKFSNNINEWPLGAFIDYSSKIERGKFNFTTLEGGRFVLIYPFIDHTKDFSLEASFIQKDGLTDDGFGLVWGRAGNNYNSFRITSNGYFKIGSTKNKSNINEYARYEKIKPEGQANSLRIEYRSKKLYCYINDEEVASIKSLPIFGNGIGFINSAAMVVEIDDFIFRQDIKINLPLGLVTDVEKVNLGPHVNTIYEELAPIISSNGSTLFFARALSIENTGGARDKQDSWFSTFQNNLWTPSRNMGSPINSSMSDNLVSVSADENTMIFVTKNGFGFREKTKSGWSNINDLGINYLNEDKYLEGNFSANGKAMLFTIMTSDNVYYRKDKAERDVYVSLKDKKGKWSPPINLGKSVNTDEDEYSPFLAADGKTLYFASKGWPGYGNADIFMTKRLDDSWKKWSEPVNLGPSINTQRFDAYYSVPASGEFAYLCSSFRSLGKSDIVLVKLPENIRPEPVVLISGKTLNAKTKEPISASIRFENLVSGEEVGEAISNPTTGNFSLVLPYGVNYGVHAEAKNFLSISENIEILQVGSYTETQKDLFLVPLEVDEAIQLNTVFFEQGKPILRAESFPELNRLAQILKDNPSIYVKLSGHTDNVGSLNMLMQLSQDRVSTVKKYLEAKGIASRRMEGHGYGATQPIEKNDTEAHRKMNRRVEFRITKK
ncbi:MAG: OmpA family protein [Cyclobacteriaceae bacterium]